MSVNKWNQNNKKAHIKKRIMCEKQFMESKFLAAVKRT